MLVRAEGVHYRAPLVRARCMLVDNRLCVLVPHRGACYGRYRVYAMCMLGDSTWPGVGERTYDAVMLAWQVRVRSLQV